MAEGQHWRQALNNFLQGAYRSVHMISWCEQPGPFSGIWTITLLWDGNPYKVGRGYTKGAAKEDAAKQALQQLHPALYAQLAAQYGG